MTTSNKDVIVTLCSRQMVRRPSTKVGVRNRVRKWVVLSSARKREPVHREGSGLLGNRTLNNVFSLNQNESDKGTASSSGGSRSCFGGITIGDMSFFSKEN